METGREFLLTAPVASPSQSESWILIVGGGPIGGAVPNIAIHYIYCYNVKGSFKYVWGHWFGEE